MATFFTDLMTSIFTPGPTSSLLIATNVSFAALQVTFFGLLIATFSIHFVVLSVLCGSLWWGINWFVAELRAHEAAEKEKAREEAEARGESSESDTDAQTVVGVKRGSGVEVREEVEGLVKRDLAESPLRSKSDVSTEDEWERVSENEKDK
ncbi:SMK killer toxin resistance protein [Pseudogymnoascus destructans]|uniref:SMK killer toxin resistance protein n=2 Tax=Pseudogymnoascus destructans TaxID=655981 RepID=L8GBT1_PSED2|nr:SMK killer toxin resistance protein [Pseudogymnoascus destructans]ELR10344.1 hypothetical protein GMDG_04726 [Pseudogymnoascus destructans 20631-21]OAF55902.1 SMK killer toxin resistance protein [Pseudogymnoascus destructans]